MIAIVLAAVGLFVYLRVSSDLDKTVDQGLRSRAGDVAALVREDDAGLSSGGSPLTERGESFAQILDGRDQVFDATPQIRKRPLLSAAELSRAQRGPGYLDRGSRPGLDEGSRLLAVPVVAQGRHLVVVVGASLEDRTDALASLGKVLLIGGPAALLLASLAGYGVAAGALRPVEAMRRRATEISAAGPGQRLPVPPSRDEIGRLGETLNAMLGRLEESFERERSFAADASHELRTPLAILKTELELALRGGRSVAELEGALRSAVEEADRLSQLAEDLLVLARSDGGRLPVRREQAEACELLAGVRSRFAGRARDGGRDLVIECAAPIGLSADPLRVEQALGNLVDNALRYGEGRVLMRATETGGMVELSVSDQGPGFPTDFIERAFERFTRADAARTRGGTGLGLSIARAIAEAHGGTASAETRSEGGAVTMLRLPQA